MNDKKTVGTRVVLECCSKTFASNKVVREVSLRIEAGEVVVLLGSSGCGKTTTLRLIAGLEQPDAGGRVFFNEKNVTHLPIEKRKVGMVFQNYALFPHLNVEDNVAYGLKIRKVEQSERRDRVADILRLMQIDSLAQRRIGQLSGGQQQRVALARALVVRPTLLLMDEPLAALDAQLRTSIREDMHRLLHKVGITTLYVTHDQDEAMAIADRIVVMQKGTISQQGSSEDLYRNPRNRFVAHFIGQMNTIPVEVRQGVLEVESKDQLVKVEELKDGAYQLLFRPERAYFIQKLRQEDVKNYLCIPVVLENQLFLGHRTITFVYFNHHSVRIEVDEEFHFHKGQSIWLKIPLDALFFSPQTEAEDQPVLKPRVKASLLADV